MPEYDRFLVYNLPLNNELHLEVLRLNTPTDNNDIFIYLFPEVEPEVDLSHEPDCEHDHDLQPDPEGGPLIKHDRDLDNDPDSDNDL